MSVSVVEVVRLEVSLLDERWDNRSMGKDFVRLGGEGVWGGLRVDMLGMARVRGVILLFDLMWRDPDSLRRVISLMAEI
jgi:hypothetical protein